MLVHHVLSKALVFVWPDSSYVRSDLFEISGWLKKIKTIKDDQAKHQQIPITIQFLQHEILICDHLFLLP